MGRMDQALTQPARRRHAGRRGLGLAASTGLLVAAAALALVAGCAMTEQELERVLEDAVRCEPGDECVVHMGSDCRCPRAINAAAVSKVDEALQDYDCQGLYVTCRVLQNPRCEGGLCVADDVGCCW